VSEGEEELWVGGNQKREKSSLAHAFEEVARETRAGRKRAFSTKIKLHEEKKVV